MLSAIDDKTIEEKKRFAELYLRSREPFKVAQIIAPGPANVGRALQIADNWLSDPIVVEEMKKLNEEKGSSAFNPSRDDILRDIKDRADLAKDPKDYAGLMRLYCDVAGHIEKPGANTANVNVAVQAVMVVKSQGSDDEWERKTALAQRTLIDESRD